MHVQGRSVLPAGADGLVMDRLAGLESVISRELVWQALEATNRRNTRRCRLSHEVMLWVVLAMGLLTDRPLRQVFRCSRRLRADEKAPGRSALCVARQRLGVEPLIWLHKQVVRLLATPGTPGAFYKGLRLIGIDGTVMDVPDSQANDLEFGRPKNGRGPGAFPQVRKLSLVEIGTHVELFFTVGGCCASERTLMQQLWEHVPSDALLIRDKGFFSYTDWKTLSSRGIQLLSRVSSSLILKPLQRLPDGSQLTKIYPSASDRAHDRHGILVRLIKYTIDDPQRTGHQEEHLLMTTLLDDQLYPCMELIELYHERWEAELTDDEQKTHQDPIRAEKPAHLRSETPSGVIQEIYALSLGHFVIRALMFEAASQEDLDVDRLSFTGCFHILQDRLPECDTRTKETFAQWLAGLYREMREERVPPRANRINPRVIKRQTSKWPKRRAVHRRIPPLRKSFLETVLLTN